MSRKVAFRKKRQNRLGMLLVSTVVVMLLGVVAINSFELSAKLNTNIAKVELIQAQLSKEEQRSEDLVEYEKYTHTKKYVEEIAKEKLGLVYDNEIIFKSGD